ncbi:hypothetical protein ACIGCK_01100 [Microbacterium sp. NPDC078428]|uniref:hypothetical protein n=1 Tax=Microbacterium sp. NPDC078428 TaxID=3364190 RepID=UPI0037C67778
MTEPRKRPAYESPRDLVAPLSPHSRMPRPLATTAGAGLVLLRVMAGVLWLWSLVGDWGSILRDTVDDIGVVTVTPDVEQAALAIVVAVVGVTLALDLTLAIFIYRGHNWPRVIVMIVSTLSISAAFLQWWTGDQDIRMSTTLLTLGLDVLVLLALSSRDAAAYARRPRR